MLAFSALVAGSFSLGALVANEVDPAALTAIRFLLAAAVLGALAVVLSRHGGFRPAHFRAPWRYLLLAALFAGYFVLMFEGLKTAHPVSAGAVFTLTPLITAACAWPLLGQRPDRRILLALAIGAAGALWVIFRADLRALLAFQIGRGEAIYFIGVICHAVFTPMLKKLNRGEPALVTTTMVMAAGFGLLLAWAWREIAAIGWLSLAPWIWAVILYLVLATTALTVVLLNFAAQRLPSSKVMAYTYLTPAWIILWELALGHGAPGALILPGVALIVIALLLLLREDRPAPPQPPG
ncbi:DMT family transporter [Pararhodobacter sp. SW119]|uniref:DMT family transporter n=1 Tax=Pararhodobacter sp. SW119 TaxID=2780075 RepID=UPI001AE0291D|nr:DMT family transporter [Pararhodobacter sp. SW119]